MEQYVVYAQIIFEINDEYRRIYDIHLGIIDAKDKADANIMGTLLLEDYCNADNECHYSDCSLYVKKLG